MNTCGLPSGLQKAHTSDVYFDYRDGKAVVVKRISTQAQQNEVFFHKIMKERGLPAMNARIKKEELLLDFIDGATLLSESQSSENYFKFGQAVREMHAISFATSQILDNYGKLQPLIWGDFIEQTFCFGLNKQRVRVGFTENKSNQIINTLHNYNFDFPETSALLHGDLHANNVMFTNGQTILFDPADWIVSGDVYYDLALVAMDASPELLLAFVEGYGEDFTQNKNKLNAYTLLRAFERWPNRYEPHIPQLVERLLQAK